MTEVVEFPEKDESVGTIYVSWIGPPAQDFITTTGLQVLGEYLTDSAVSPLYQQFVEIEEPTCTGSLLSSPLSRDRADLSRGADISFASSTQDPSVLTAYLYSVPSANLKTLDGEFKDALARIAKEGIDMTRMASILEKQRLQTLEAIETDAADSLSNSILTGA